ncbi:MAG: hypothetical protein HZB65_02785 [Candidatus Aenigmarchaeota archaeon]|nr:hypothetical protein [Candidatus Aenigmarchaeota archaeon]
MRYEYYGQFYLAFEPDTLIRDCVFDTVSEDTLIAVDGGINPETASLVIDAGATHLIAASAITKDWEKCSIEELRNRIDSLKGAEYPITR